MLAASDIFVHPRALCESQQVGKGTRIWAFAHVMRGAVVGCDCNIGDHAFIETGARIGDRVTLKNQAMVWDGVEIGDDVFVGPGVSFPRVVGDCRFRPSLPLTKQSPDGSRADPRRGWREPWSAMRNPILAPMRWSRQAPSSTAMSRHMQW